MKPRLTFAGLVLATCCFGSTRAAGQGAPADSMRALLEQAWHRAREAHVVPGAVVAVVRDGQVVALRGFGYASIEDSVPADPGRSVYRLASIAKLFVASVVMQMVDSGRLDLERPVADLTPSVPIPPGEGTVTLRHLLTHTAGFDERVIGYAAPTPGQLRPLGEYLSDRMPDRGWRVGELFGYSNHGVALAAYAAEVTAGMRFDSLAARLVFDRLGMTRTWYIAPGDAERERDIAPAYRCGPGGCERRATLWSHLYPVGLAFSTATDMGRFMVEMLSKPSLMDQQFTHADWSPGIATSFFLHSVKGHRVASHPGGAPGSATLLALVPDERLGIFIATNAGEPGFTNTMFRAIVDSLLPDRSGPAPVSAGPVNEYEGSYLLTRYAHRTVERLPAAFAFTATAEALGDTLLIDTGGEPRRFVRVDSLKLRELGGDGRAVLARNEAGRISMLYTGVLTGGSEIPGALERVPWYEGTVFLNEYASWLIGGPLLVWGAWLIVAAVQAVRRKLRRDRTARSGTLPGNVALAVGLVHTLAATTFFTGFLIAGARDISSGSGIMFGMSTGKVILLRLAWVAGILAIPIALSAVRAWRERWWSWFGRACYTMLAFGAVLTAHFLVWWNYIPGRW
jgi:CubicO group peptidase (beta-lactamase class C family)